MITLTSGLCLAFASSVAAFGTPDSANAAHPAPSVSEPSAAAQTNLPHISIVAMGSPNAKGAPLLFLPGLASPRAVWDSFASDLARDHRVYLVQVNGFGGELPGQNLRGDVLAGIVADIHGYLSAHERRPVRIVGHSMGGLVGMMTTRDHPDQVERLMIVDSLPYFPVLLAKGGPLPPKEKIEQIAQMMRTTVANRYGKPVDAESLKSDVDALALKESSRGLMRSWAATADPRVTAEILYEDMTTDLRPALPAMKASITVLYPWDDSAFGKDRTSAFYRLQYGAAPNVTYVDVANAGHFVMLDQQAAFQTALDQFAR